MQKGGRTLSRCLESLVRRLGGVLPFVMLFAFTDCAASAQSVKAYTVAGSVAKRCTVSPASIAVTYRRTGNSATTTVAGTIGNSTTVTVRCNASTGGTLSVVATTLASGGQTSQAYSIAATGWGSTDITYTAGNAAASRSNAATTATVTVSVSGFPASNNFANNTTYSSTITLGVVAN